MFYSVELLSIRRHAKFAKCWLAANLSAKVFQNKFRRQTIFAISIPETCRELIVYINTHDSDRRFSLYLSSQLMFGVTRILYYQTDLFLKVQLQLWISVSTKSRIPDEEHDVEKKKRKKLQVLPVDRTLLPPEEPPALVHILQNNMVDESAITMHESDDVVKKYHMTMRDPGNFGVLTAEEMEQFLQPGGWCLTEPQPEQVRNNLQMDESPPHIFQLPSLIEQQRTLTNGHTSQIPNGTLTEIPLPILTEEPISTERFELHKEVTGTPIKRKLQSPSASETPSKKKAGLDSRGDAAEPEGVLKPTDQPVIEITNQISSSQLSLDTVEDGEYLLRRPRKKGKKLIIDNKTRLPDFHWPPEQEQTFTDRVEIPTSSTNTLLNTPSSRLAWGKTLLGRYQATIAELMELIRLTQKKKPRLPEGGLPREAVRAPEPLADEPPVDMSSDLKGATTLVDSSKVDDSKTLVSISIEEKPLQIGLPPVSEFPVEITDAADVLEKLPELPAIPESPFDVSNLPKKALPFIRDWTEEGEIPSITRFSSARRTSDRSVTHVTSNSKESHDTSASRSMGTNWVKADVLGTLEVLWQTKKIVVFRDVCPPKLAYTKKDAGQLFALLLELQKSTEVKLTQAAPYRNIYIQKYSAFF